MVARVPFTRPLLAAGLALAVFGSGVANRVDGASTRLAVQVTRAASVEPAERPATVPPGSAESRSTPSLPADPPPFAPGGDDLLASSEMAAPEHRRQQPAVSEPRPAPGHQPQPGFAATIRIALPPGLDGTATAGDFFREGRLALFIARRQGHRQPVPHFLAPDATGRWVDRSAELLSDDADGALCEAPRQALTAELNGDGVPDVLVACAATAAESRRLVVFLSRPDGRYARAETAAPAGPHWLEVLRADAAAWAAGGRRLSSSGTR